MAKCRVWVDTGCVPALVYERRRWPPSAQGLGLASLLVVLSFLPSEAKALLHTRGSLHYWAHVGVFVALAVLFCEATLTARSRTAALVGVALLGCLIEGFEVAWRWPALEFQDVACDLIGVVLGWVFWAGQVRMRAWPTRDLVEDAGLTRLPKAVQGRLPRRGDRARVVTASQRVERGAAGEEAA